MARSFVLLLVACSAFAQERVQLEVPRGSVGAVFVRPTGEVSPIARKR